MATDSKETPAEKKRNPYEPKPVHLVWKIPLWLAISLLMIVGLHSKVELPTGSPAFLGWIGGETLIIGLVSWVLFYFLIIRYKGKLTGTVSLIGIAIVTYALLFLYDTKLENNGGARKEALFRLAMLLDLKPGDEVPDSLINSNIAEDLGTMTGEPEDKDYNAFFLFLQNSVPASEKFDKSVYFRNFTNFTIVEDLGDLSLIEKAVLTSRSANEEALKELTDPYNNYYNHIIHFNHPDKQLKKNAVAFQTYFMSFRKMFKMMYGQRNKLMDDVMTVVILMRSKEGKWKNEGGRIVFKDKASQDKYNSKMVSITTDVAEYNEMKAGQRNMLRQAYEALLKEKE